MNQNEIMAELIEYAYKKMLNKSAYPFCAFVVKEGVIISRGFNERVILYGDITTHGEMEAIRRAAKVLQRIEPPYLKGYSLYSTCEPCLACFDTALWCGIDEVVVSVDHTDFPEYFHRHPYTIENYATDFPGKIKYQPHVLQHEGIELFKEAKKKYGW